MLSVLGVAYAHWSETLTINGTVDTGKLELELSCTCSDNDDAEKDVAEITCTVTDLEDEPDSVTITITNAYPCYTVYITFDVENVGTVPAVLKELYFDDTAVTLQPDMGPVIENYLEGEIPGLEVVSITWSGDPFGQIEPGHSAVVSLELHFGEDTVEDATYEFTITFVYENWSP
ncbi:hypothetical protein DRO58_05860 [Candidatus Bathyarchaeota archaeon]|nr:MAG: hypothetical protein DRO58_05860 [Candidatus Bathyarchaeota archaeon]